VPFEETLAVVFPATVSAEDVRSYVNVNLPRLERFVEREIYFRETADQVVPDSISKEEVIDETIAAALGRWTGEKPERLALEPWLYRLASMRSTNSPARREATGVRYAWKNPPARPTSKASDEPELQFHQPDEAITEETIIADDRVATPEQIVGSDEMMRLIACRSARCGREPSRGFHPACHRRLRGRRNLRHHRHSAGPGIDSISAARDHLRKSPQFVGQFKRAVRAHWDRVNPIPTERKWDSE
jgi:hypothetical protein